jgi:hypothetical protein
LNARKQNAAITSNRQWAQACGVKTYDSSLMPEEFGFPTLPAGASANSVLDTIKEWPQINIAMMTFVFFLGLFAIFKSVFDAQGPPRWSRG